MSFRRRVLSAYFMVASRAEIIAAWLLTVSSHGDHIGHPFI